LLLVLGTATNAAEPVWLPVEDLIVDQIEPVMNIKGQPIRKLGLAVRGVFPLQRQLANLGAEGVGDNRFEVIDFELERQSMGAGTNVSTGWKQASVTMLSEVLQSADGFAVDPVDATKLDSATSMPLPQLTEGAWGKAVSHPKLQQGTKQLLFRFVDFDVEPGRYYRYRVRLEIRNPFYKQVTTDPFVALDGTRKTPWSQPSTALLIERKPQEE
jgi:hypothetical protein